MSATQTLSFKQIMIMSVSAGICVANIYYSQPILADIARSLKIDVRSAGYISVFSQAGYGLGLLFLTPLGDKFDRKKLILWLQLLLITALVGITFATGKLTLYAASAAIGLFAVAAQVILPMAASLVTENRGKVVGVIFTGILIGVLAARIFSGFVTDWLGWKFVYLISAVLVAISAVLMQADFPSSKDRFKGSYTDLLASVFIQFRRFPLLRRTAFVGALSFGILSSFWIALTFHLSGSPFFYVSEKIGLFGLLAVGGALAVPVFGKLADKSNNPKKSLILSISLVLAAIALIAVFPDWLPAFWIAVVLLDLGVQATQVTNIALIYTLDPTANSRINTVYMTFYFIGGAVGASIGIFCWQTGGWNLVMAQLAVFAIAALALVVFSKHKKV